MDLFSGLTYYWTGLVASTLLALNLMFGSALATLTSLSSSFEEQLSAYGIDIDLAQEPRAHTTAIPIPAATSTSVASVPLVSSTATTTKKIPTKKPATPATTVATPTTPQTPLTPIIAPEQVNTSARASIVNILCIAQGAGGVRSISGSGVIIDTRGVVLTNAHIAQYLLLRDYSSKNAIDCTVRTGSPATPSYRATLLYLPPAWIEANASQIIAEQGMGTGEHDYAFLYITESTNPSGTLPSSYTNVSMSSASPTTGDGVLVAGYPAGFLDGQTIQKSLYPTSAFTNIGQLYTFNAASNVDVVSVGGTVVSQGGSSGGAVLRTYDGKLVGLISTATAGTTTASRDLRAITIGYIDRDLRESGKGGLVEFLSENLASIAAAFAQKSFIDEKQALVNVITH
ncbi:MAG: serine protease [Patescibacteria group bacterium]